MNGAAPDGGFSTQEEKRSHSDRPRVVVAVCTFRRDEPLRRLLDGLVAAAERAKNRASLGVVIVDDTPEGMAERVVSEYPGRFEGGCAYRISGKGNISIARNLAMDTALALGADWIAMTDDDCEPAVDWLNAYLDVLERTDATAVTGPMVRRFPPGSPAWLSEQPFGLLGVDEEADLAEVTTGSTNNSIISGAWLREQPVRFEPGLGIIGGEDMVFYRTARAAGLKIHFSRDALVYEDQPADRSTFGYQVKRFFWQGNSSFVTCVMTGKSRHRMMIHGLACVARAVRRPLARVARGWPPEWRYAAALLAEGFGKISGYLGFKIRHH